MRIEEEEYIYMLCFVRHIRRLPNELLNVNGVCVCYVFSSVFLGCVPPMNMYKYLTVLLCLSSYYAMLSIFAHSLYACLCVPFYRIGLMIIR